MKPDLVRRSTLPDWLKYIVNNPIYFEDSFQLRFCEQNIEIVAYSLFKDHIDLGIVRVPHSKRSTVLRGTNEMAQYLGIKHKTMQDYVRHKRKPPCWKEDGIWLVHKGRLRNWAIRRGIGKYAKSN